MAYTLSLSDGTTTHDLNNSTNYQVMEGGVSLPPPPKKQIFGGDNPYRDGADLIESRYHNRVVTIRLRIKGTSDDNLATAVRNLNDMLEDAKTFASVGRGAQVTLTYKLDAGSVSVIFDVLDGSLTLPDNWHNTPMLDKNSMVVGAMLTLTCKPFGRGAQQALENYARNPDFELGDGGSPVHDWAATNATLSQDADEYLGTYAMKVLANCIAGQQGLASQSITWAAAYQGQAFTSSLYYKIPAGNNREQRIAIYDGVSETASAALTAQAYTLVTLSKTLDAAATELTIRIYANYVAGADVNDYILVDRLGVWLASSAPIAWISGRQVTNRNDPDNGDNSRQINYVDIVGAGGDTPGGLKLYIEEVQNETRMVFGARHGSEARNSLYREQDGTVEAGTSNGQYLELTDTGAGNSATSPTITISSPPTGIFRVWARINRDNWGASNIALGWTYGSTSYVPASGEYIATVANYNWYDLGVVSIPPIDMPEGETAPSLILRIYCSAAATLTGRLDVIMLFPVRVREGYVAADHASATKQILLNSESGVFIMTTADVLDGVPTALIGKPASIDPTATRIHFIAPGVQPLTDAFLVSAKITPRYLLI